MTFLEQVITGRTILFSDLDRCVDLLIDAWMASCHELPNGEVGWYRRLTFTQRVGNVATAQAVRALTAGGKMPPRPDAVVRTLLNHQRPEGAWPFVSNLTNVGVVDSTAFVVMALNSVPRVHRDEIFLLKLAKALDWLERASLPEGGWGLIDSSPLRAYSTALSIEALCSGGRGHTLTVRRAVQRLIETADPGTGCWHDSARQLSIPVTARVLIALLAACQHQTIYRGAIARPVSWLRSIAAASRLWLSSDIAATHEEVEVRLYGELIRIEYRHSPRPLAVTALVQAGHARDPHVCLAIRDLITSATAGHWNTVADSSARDVTSWMLHDVLIAFISFRAAFPPSIYQIWVHRTRVVAHPRGRRAIIKLLINQRMKLVTLALGGLLAWVLVEAGLVPNFGFAMLQFVLASLALDVLANFLYDLFPRRRPADLHDSY